MFSVVCPGCSKILPPLRRKNAGLNQDVPTSINTPSIDLQRSFRRRVTRYPGFIQLSKPVSTKRPQVPILGEGAAEGFFLTSPRKPVQLEHPAATSHANQHTAPEKEWWTVENTSCDGMAKRIVDTWLCLYLLS
jgi:hypothetical protein